MGARVEANGEQWNVDFVHRQHLQTPLSFSIAGFGSHTNVAMIST